MFHLQCMPWILLYKIKFSPSMDYNLEGDNLDYSRDNVRLKINFGNNFSVK